MTSSWRTCRAERVWRVRPVHGCTPCHATLSLLFTGHWATQPSGRWPTGPSRDARPGRPSMRRLRPYRLRRSLVHAHPLIRPATPSHATSPFARVTTASAQNAMRA